MKNVLLILSIAAVLLLFSCKKEQPPASGSISGNLSSYDPATPLVKTPVEGIKLWLLNADFKFDTVTFTGNNAAIVDSNYSDSKGNYLFDNIPLGNYYVCPAPDTSDYRFESIPAGNAIPLSITEASPNQSLSFSSPWPGGENESQFAIDLKVIRNGNNVPSYFKWNRQVWALFLPYFEPMIAGDFTEQKFFLDTIPVMVSKSFNYGFFGFFFTRTNNFLLDFYNSGNVKIDSYWIVQDLGNTPSASTWEIDLNAHSITRTSP